METINGKRYMKWNHTDCDPENCQCASWEEYYKKEKAYQSRKERLKEELTFALRTTLPGVRQLIDREEMEASELAKILLNTLGNPICFDLIEFIDF